MKHIGIVKIKNGIPALPTKTGKDFAAPVYNMKKI